MICANEDCAKDFEQKTHNQKYCSEDCCRVSTNKKIMQKYYEKKAIRNGAKRICKKCHARLSRYNSDNLCAKCIKSRSSKYNKEIIGMINDISFS